MELKECECGCGKPAPIARFANPQKGYVQGQSMRFLRGHNARVVHYALKHGYTRRGVSTAEYRAYIDARFRCTNPKSTGWKNYGGRGVEFRFNSIDEFVAEVGQRPSPQHSLGRIDINGHYERGNVCWKTRSEQALSRRPYPRPWLRPVTRVRDLGRESIA